MKAMASRKATRRRSRRFQSGSLPPRRGPGLPVSARHAAHADGCELVLVTGTGSSGSGASAQLTNTLFDEDGVVGTFSWQHLPGPFSGAGSTMSGALVALMAHRIDTVDATQAAQEFTVGALAHAQRLGMGKLVPNKYFRFPPFSLSSLT